MLKMQVDCMKTQGEIKLRFFHQNKTQYEKENIMNQPYLDSITVDILECILRQYLDNICIA